MSLATGTYLPVLDGHTQDMIEAVMVRTTVAEGLVCAPHVDKEDIRQDLMEVALRAARRYDGSVKFTTYLWPRINGECYDKIRRGGQRYRRGRLRPRVGPLPEAGTNEPDWDYGEDDGIDGALQLADLSLALSRLPDRLRLVLYLLFYDGLELAEVARRLCMTGDLVRELRDVALMKMRLCLAERIG